MMRSAASCRVCDHRHLSGVYRRKLPTPGQCTYRARFWADLGTISPV